MFNFKLDLIGIKDDDAILEDYFESDTGEITLIISLKRKIQICPVCGSIHTTIHSKRIKKIIHSYSNDFPATILYNQKRYRCNDCLNTFIEPNNFNLGHNRISDLTIKCILKDLKTTDSYKNIADRYHVSSQTVLNYMDKYIDPKRRKLPEILCIDEFKNLSFGKGKYACLLLDYQTGKIIDVLPNRRLDSLLSYLNTIKKEET